MFGVAGGRAMLWLVGVGRGGAVASGRVLYTEGKPSAGAPTRRAAAARGEGAGNGAGGGIFGPGHTYYGWSGAGARADKSRRGSPRGGGTDALNCCCCSSAPGGGPCCMQEGERGATVRKVFEGGQNERAAGLNFRGGQKDSK